MSRRPKGCSFNGSSIRKPIQTLLQNAIYIWIIFGRKLLKNEYRVIGRKNWHFELLNHYLEKLRQYYSWADRIFVNICGWSNFFFSSLMTRKQRKPILKVARVTFQICKFFEKFSIHQLVDLFPWDRGEKGPTMAKRGVPKALLNFLTIHWDKGYLNLGGFWVWYVSLHKNNKTDLKVSSHLATINVNMYVRRGMWINCEGVVTTNYRLSLLILPGWAHTRCKTTSENTPLAAWPSL